MGVFVGMTPLAAEDKNQYCLNSSFYHMEDSEVFGTDSLTEEKLIPFYSTTTESFCHNIFEEYATAKENLVCLSEDKDADEQKHHQLWSQMTLS
jgi:hypothetical protein